MADHYELIEVSSTHDCKCGRHFNTRNGLWKHIHAERRKAGDYDA